MTHSIGFDLGGTTMTVALVDRDGKVLFSQEQDTLVSQGKESVTKRIVEMIQLALSKSEAVNSIGIGVPGLIDVNNGIVTTSPNFPDWVNYPLVKILQQTVSLPIYIDNDVRVATLGEQLFGAGQSCNNLICLTVGTGIGSGLLLNGKIFYGASYSAGEFGHMTIIPEGGKVCGCGNTGCLETLASSKAIIELATRYYSRSKSDIYSSLIQNQPLTPKLLAEAAILGCEIATHIWNQVGKWLGIALSGIVNLLNPEKIIIGGGVAEAGELLLSPIRNTIQLRAFELPSQTVEVVKAKLGPQAGIIGASKLFEVRSK